MRSRTVSRPWSRCRLTLSTPPISRANASRRASSSSSGFQFIRILRFDDLVVIMDRYRKRLSLDAVGEDIALGAFEQAAERNTELEHLRRHFPLQPQPDQVAKLQPLHHRGAHRHRAWTDTVFLVARQINQLAHPRQRVREPRYRRPWQTTAAGNFQIAQSRFMTLEAAQDVERPRKDLDDI